MLDTLEVQVPEPCMPGCTRQAGAEDFCKLSRTAGLSWFGLPFGGRGAFMNWPPILGGGGHMLETSTAQVEHA